MHHCNCNSNVGIKAFTALRLDASKKTESIIAPAGTYIIKAINHGRSPVRLVMENEDFFSSLTLLQGATIHPPLYFRSRNNVTITLTASTETEINAEASIESYTVSERAPEL